MNCPQEGLIALMCFLIGIQYVFAKNAKCAKDEEVKEKMKNLKSNFGCLCLGMYWCILVNGFAYIGNISAASLVEV